MDRKILFESDELLVRFVEAGSDRAICYVTFDSYSDARTLDRPGFGEGFFRGRGIDAVHVLSLRNRWYYDPDLPEALAAVRSVTQAYDRVVSYGSSMGGYAALRHGTACNALVGIALSPQFSIDPAVAPFENRWLTDAAGIAFSPITADALPMQYIFYDPCDALDGRHVALFAERSPTVSVKVPHGGHPVGAYLNEAGVLADVIETAGAGLLDTATILRRLRNGRRRSGQYLFTLAQRLPDRRILQKLALARMAVAANPDVSVYLSYLARLLDQQGDREEARAAHEAAVALSQGHILIVHNLVLHHEKWDELDRARDLVEMLLRDHPDRSLLHRTAKRIAVQQQRRTWWGALAREFHLEWALHLARVAYSCWGSCTFRGRTALS